MQMAACGVEEGPCGLHRAVGPWRDTRLAAEAHLAFLEVADPKAMVESLRVVLWLAAEAVEGDPDSEERMAMMLVQALVEMVELGDDET